MTNRKRGRAMVVLLSWTSLVGWLALSPLLAQNSATGKKPQQPAQTVLTQSQKPTGRPSPPASLPPNAPGQPKDENEPKPASTWSDLVHQGFNCGNILAGVVAGTVVLLLAGVPTLLYFHYGVRWRFKRFFGIALLKGNDARIVLDTYLLDRHEMEMAAVRMNDPVLAQVAKRPYVKAFSQSEEWRLPGPGESVLGFCSARGLSHLLRAITAARRSPIAVEADDTLGAWNTTIMSIGGPAGSWHSRKILEENGDFYVVSGKGRYHMAYTENPTAR